MKTFITGATGFIGRSVARQLREAGHEVIGLVRNPDSAVSKPLAEIGVKMVAGDITDKESLREPMKGVDGVFHIAGWYKVGAKDTKAGEAINIEGTRNVLEMVKELKVPRCVYTSTMASYGDTKGQMAHEGFPATGRLATPYEVTKWKAHHEVAEPMMMSGVPVIIVNPGVVYGPGDVSVFDQMIRLWLKGLLPVVPAQSRYCWAHVDDIARGHILAMEKGKIGETYNLSGPVYSLVEILGLVGNLTGLWRPRIGMPTWSMQMNAPLMGLLGSVFPLPDPFSADAMAGSGGTNIGPYDKAQKELGWSVRPIEEGMRETLRHMLPRINVKPGKAL
jgi:nucleoside-diphosphate-sugar epimerase